MATQSNDCPYIIPNRFAYMAMRINIELHPWENTLDIAYFSLQTPVLKMIYISKGHRASPSITLEIYPSIITIPDGNNSGHLQTVRPPP